MERLGSPKKLFQLKVLLLSPKISLFQAVTDPSVATGWCLILLEVCGESPASISKGGFDL